MSDSHHAPHSRAEVADLLRGIEKLLGKGACDQGLDEDECDALGTVVSRVLEMLVPATAEDVT